MIPRSAAPVGSAPALATVSSLPVGAARAPVDGPTAAAAATIDHPSGFLAIAPRNQRFTVDGVPGFVAYRRHGHHRICFGAAHAPAWCRENLLDAFLAASAADGDRVTMVQVRAADIDPLRRRGFRVNQFGSSYGLDLGRFTFAGTKRMKLRNRMKQASNAGVTVYEAGRDRPMTPELWNALEAISAKWLRGKGNHELDFLIGELGGPNDPNRRFFVAEDADHRPLGFITYVPVWGARPGWLHDLTRRLPKGPPGVMELINATAVGRFLDERVPYLHFGLTPFIVDPEEPGGVNGSSTVARLVRLIGRWGSFIYPARAQLQYKHKWAPDVVDREFIAFQKVSFGALWALLNVTGSLPWGHQKRVPALLPAAPPDNTPGGAA